MGSRSSLVVLIIGIVAVGAFGFLMKIALDSTPGLIEIGKIKKAIASSYSDRGLDEVKIRPLPKKLGYKIQMVFEEIPTEGGSQEVLSRDVAALFLKTFKGQKRRNLEVTLLQSSGWGCGGDKVVSQQEYYVPNLLMEINIEAALKELVGKTEPNSGLRVVAAESLGMDSTRIEVISEVVSEDISEVERDEIFKDSEAFVWKSLHGVPVRWVTLVLRSSEESEPILKQEKVERPKVENSRYRQQQKTYKVKPGEVHLKKKPAN